MALRGYTFYHEKPYLVGVVSRTGMGLRLWEVRIHVGVFPDPNQKFLKRRTRSGALATVARVFAEHGVDIRLKLMEAERESGAL
jgi:hypothetical protein